MSQAPSPEDEARFQAAYQRALEIIDQSWLDSGMTPEELAACKAVEERLMSLLDQGLTVEEAEQILAENPNLGAEV